MKKRMHILSNQVSISPPPSMLQLKNKDAHQEKGCTFLATNVSPPRPESSTKRRRGKRGDWKSFPARIEATDGIWEGIVLVGRYSGSGGRASAGSWG